MINKIRKFILDWINQYEEKIVMMNYHSRIEEKIKKGMKVGDNVIISTGVTLDNNFPFLISIGNNCIIAEGTKILTHDATLQSYINGHERGGKVEIKDNCIIGLNSIILPGVTIGPNVLIAAGSVINKDIPPNSCVAGVPARFYSNFDTMIDTYKKNMEKGPIYNCKDIKKKMKVMNKECIKKVVIDANKGDIYFSDIGLDDWYPTKMRHHWKIISDKYNK